MPPLNPVHCISISYDLRHLSLLYMKPNKPTLNDWKRLYDAAIEFKRVRPWTWMSDADLFGVQHPDTGEIGYCSIMGALGQVYAIVLYPGDEALQDYLKLQSGVFDYEDSDAIYLQKCLMASFEDRDRIDKTDYGIIKKLGLKFRGRNSWPLFRCFLPGYVPWYLTKKEANFLTLALQQAIDVSQRFKEDDNLLLPDDDESRILVKVFGKSNAWEDAYHEIPFLEETESVMGPVDEIRLRKIKKSTTRTDQTWEIDSYYFPNAVAEGDRPYFPKALVVMDHESEAALHYFLGSPEGYYESFRDQLLTLFEETKNIPDRILVDKGENQKIFKPIASGLGIRLDRVDRLPGAEAFKEGMFEYFLGGTEDDLSI